MTAQRFHSRVSDCRRETQSEQYTEDRQSERVLDRPAAGSTSFFLRQTLFLRLINVLDCATPLSATDVAGGAGARLFYQICSHPERVGGAQDTPVVVRGGIAKAIWCDIPTLELHNAAVHERQARSDKRRDGRPCLSQQPTILLYKHMCAGSPVYLLLDAVGADVPTTYHGFHHHCIVMRSTRSTEERKSVQSVQSPLSPWVGGSFRPAWSKRGWRSCGHVVLSLQAPRPEACHVVS